MPNEFADLIKLGNDLHLSLGEEDIFDRKLSQGALLNKENLGKSIVAKKDLYSGTVLTAEDVSILSPGQGLPPTELENLVGKILQKDVQRHEFIFTDIFLDLLKVTNHQNSRTKIGVYRCVLMMF